MDSFNPPHFTTQGAWPEFLSFNTLSIHFPIHRHIGTAQAGKVVSTAARPSAHTPVAVNGVLVGQLAELLVHLAVEVVAQEERPEAEEGVHLLRLPDPEALTLCRTGRPLVVDSWSRRRVPSPFRTSNIATSIVRHLYKHSTDRKSTNFQPPATQPLPHPRHQSGSPPDPPLRQRARYLW